MLCHQIGIGTCHEHRTIFQRLIGVLSKQIELLV